MASSSVFHYVRENDDTNEDEDVYSYYIALEQTSTESDPSEAETVESVQANTTVSAKDSSDISTDDISDYYMSEYEVVSSTETIEPSVYDKEMFSSSSSPRDIGVHISCTDSNYSNLTDISEFDGVHLGTNVDNKFYHTCAQCFARNSNPAFRFCDSCYQLRKEFYPTKPLRKQKRKRIDVSNDFTKRMKTTENVFESSSNANNVDSRSSDQGFSVLDSGFESLSPSAEWEITETKDKCLTCLSSCVNGLFLHGKTAHRCCCYKCSKKIWSKTRKCPICRRKIHNVILLLNC